MGEKNWISLLLKDLKCVSIVSQKAWIFSKVFFVWIETSVRVEIHISIIRISWKVMEIFGHLRCSNRKNLHSSVFFFENKKSCPLPAVICWFLHP